VQYLAARNITVQAATSAISGAFNATDAVSLSTTNAAIDVRVDLYSAGANSTLALETTNGCATSPCCRTPPS
jgi:hypothetical protein